MSDILGITPAHARTQLHILRMVDRPPLPPNYFRKEYKGKGGSDSKHSYGSLDRVVSPYYHSSETVNPGPDMNVRCRFNNCCQGEDMDESKRESWEGMMAYLHSPEIVCMGVDSPTTRKEKHGSKAGPTLRLVTDNTEAIRSEKEAANQEEGAG